MEYIAVPKQINIKECANNDFSFSPSKYKKVNCINASTYKLGDLLDRELRTSDRGIEIGSASYIRESPYKFIRTKGIKPDSFLPYFRTDSVVSILPGTYKNYHLKEGDILISKDSNIGETAILDRNYDNYMISGGIYRLPISKNKYYVLGFLKHEFFMKQLDFLTSRGATIRHAKTLFLDCVIPFPNQIDKDEVVTYIELMVQSIIMKEKLLRAKNSEIINIIDEEIKTNQNPGEFNYRQPNIKEIIFRTRMDSSLYVEEFQKNEFAVKNYMYGSLDLISRGYKWARGTSLEIQGLGTRLNSNTYRDGFYELVIPTNITEFGTVSKSTYIGTAKRLKTIKQGDIIFGGEGFGKGRSFVVCNESSNIATNYHGIRIYNEKIDLTESIFVRCFISYWRSLGMIDYIGVGGSGGHCAPQYFNLIEIPNFPQTIQERIATLYHHEQADIEHANIRLDDLREIDLEWANDAGIIELDLSIKKLKRHLDTVLEQIISDQNVNIDPGQLFLNSTDFGDI